MTNSVERKAPQALGNRRAHRRAALTSPVLIDSARAHQTARCRDVSVGGLCLEVDSDLPVGAQVELYFELPTGIAIEASAEVARRNERALAMRFQNLSPESRAALGSFCEAWRTALLDNCAQRAASLPNLRLTSPAIKNATASAPPDSDFDANEAHSGVRIRTAAEWTGSEREPKLA